MKPYIIKPYSLINWYWVLWEALNPKPVFWGLMLTELVEGPVGLQHLSPRKESEVLHRFEMWYIIRSPGLGV